MSEDFFNVLVLKLLFTGFVLEQVWLISRLSQMRDLIFQVMGLSPQSKDDVPLGNFGASTLPFN